MNVLQELWVSGRILAGSSLTIQKHRSWHGLVCVGKSV